MFVKHYYKQTSIGGENKQVLLNLISDSNLFSDNDLDAVINPRHQKTIICAFDDYNSICGFATVVDEENYVYLSELYVEPRSQRKGYGKGLIEAVKQFAKAKKYDIVSLMVRVNNKYARALYENKRFVYDSFTNGNIALVMKKYTDNSVYCVGGVLYEMAKQYGEENISMELAKKILLSDDITPYTKYFRGKNIEDSVRKCLQSSLFKDAVTLFREEREAGNFTLVPAFVRQVDIKIDKIFQDIYKETLSLPSERRKTTALCVDAYESLKKQENILKIEKERVF